ncbi:hypothetical protein Zmor_006458 [Zophobas morio]|uniref:Uncharacterized protein n=1 Tax=Zophobas morio TaxID=2755281 RepID=A0AA38J015_9CUCU|nr:hypothetical protein Zmor_006458 [Zophobas morio]
MVTPTSTGGPETTTNTTSQVALSSACVSERRSDGRRTNGRPRTAVRPPAPGQRLRAEWRSGEMLRVARQPTPSIDLAPPCQRDPRDRRRPPGFALLYLAYVYHTVFLSFRFNRGWAVDVAAPPYRYHTTRIYFALNLPP